MKKKLIELHEKRTIRSVSFQVHTSVENFFSSLALVLDFPEAFSSRRRPIKLPNTKNQIQEHNNSNQNFFFIPRMVFILTNIITGVNKNFFLQFSPSSCETWNFCFITITSHPDEIEAKIRIIETYSSPRFSCVKIYLLLLLFSLISDSTVRYVALLFARFSCRRIQIYDGGATKLRPDLQR